MSEEKKKLTIGQWMENFWYYNKWKVVIGAVLVIALWVGVKFYIDTLAQSEKTGDITVVSVFSGKLTPEEVDFDKRLTDSVKDIDGDGKISVTYTPHYIGAKGTDEDKVAQAQFEQGLSKCYGDVLLFDKTTLDTYVKKDIFEPIENYVDLSAVNDADIVKQGDVAVAVRLTNSQILRDMHFVVDEVYVSVMFIPDDADDALLASRENAKGAIAKLLEKSEEPIEEDKE